MPAKMVVPGVYYVSLGPVNAFLIDHDGLTLVDTGIPGSAGKILDAVREIGKKPEDIRQVLLTHVHADHTGSLAPLKRELGVPAYMHPLDAELLARVLPVGRCAPHLGCSTACSTQRSSRGNRPCPRSSLPRWNT